MYSFFYSSFLSCTLVRWSLLLPFRYLIHVYAYIPLTVDTFVITSTWPNQRWIYYYNTKFDIHFIVLTQFSLSWAKLCIGRNEDEWWMDGVANDNRVSYILLESSVDCPKIMSITNRSTSTELPNLGESEGRKKTSIEWIVRTKEYSNDRKFIKQLVFETNLFIWSIFSWAYVSPQWRSNWCYLDESTLCITTQFRWKIDDGLFHFDFLWNLVKIVRIEIRRF